MDNNSKMDILKVILCLICTFLVVFIVIYKRDDIKNVIKNRDAGVEVNKDALKFKEEYESLNGQKTDSGKTYPKVVINKNNAIKYSNSDEVIDIIKNKTGVIYLGYPKCPWCRNAVPVLLQAASDTGLENIYYIDMYDERDSYSVDEDGELVKEKEGTDGYKKLLEALDAELDDYIVEANDGKEIKTGEKRIYVPYVIFVREGKIIGIHDDTVKSQKDPYKVLDEKQTEELYDIYSDYIHKVLDDLCDDRC